MRRRFFVLTLLACCVPAAVFAGEVPPLRLHELRCAGGDVGQLERRQPHGHHRRLVQRRP